MSDESVRCSRCGGDGWTIAPGPGPDPNGEPVPVQEQCQACQGTGEIGP